MDYEHSKFLKNIDVTQASYNSFDAILAEQLSEVTERPNTFRCRTLTALPLACKRYFYSLEKIEQQYVLLFVQHQTMKVNGYLNQKQQFVVRDTTDPHYVNIFENPHFTYERMLVAIFADLFHLQEHANVLNEFDHLLHTFEEFQHLLRIESNYSSRTYSNKLPG